MSGIGENGPQKVDKPVNTLETNKPENPYSLKNIAATVARKSDSVKSMIAKYTNSPELTTYTNKKDAELRAILEGKDSKEKSSEKVKAEIVDGVLKEKYGKLYERAIANGQTPKELREKYLDSNEKILDKKIVDKDGKEINKTKYDDILEKNKALSSLNTEKNPEFVKELLSVYGTNTIKQYEEILDESGKKGEKLPKNLEEFDKFIEAKIIKKEIEQLQKEDPKYKPNKEEVKKRVEKAREANPNYTKSALTNYNSAGSKYNFEKNPNNAANKEMITTAINSLPENSKARAMLVEAEKYIGLNENNPSDNKKLKVLLGFDPAKTPWCKGFVNAIAKKSGISLNSAGNLSSRAGEGDGRKLKLPGEKPMPGDLVVSERKGLTSAGTPGGHIGIFLGMSASGNPIIIGGNQGRGEVSIKEERRPIISINRVVSDEEEQNNKNYMNGKKDRNIESEKNK